MAQKAHPNSLENNHETFQDCAYWNETQLDYIICSIYNLIKDCCRRTDIHLYNAKVGTCPGAAPECRGSNTFSATSEDYGYALGQCSMLGGE